MQIQQPLRCAQKTSGKPALAKGTGYSKYNLLYLMFSTYEKNKKISGACHSFVLCLDMSLYLLSFTLTKECVAFSNVSVFGVHTENGSFSKFIVFICIFISVFI